MRTYGRQRQEDGSLRWIEITTDALGYDDAVWLETLIQTLLLGRGESPFFANYGIPAQQAVVQQVFPDIYVALTQQQFAQHFSALTIAKIVIPRTQSQAPYPAYAINVVFHNGAKLDVYVPFPQ